MLFTVALIYTYTGGVQDKGSSEALSVTTVVQYRTCSVTETPFP